MRKGFIMIPEKILVNEDSSHETKRKLKHLNFLLSFGCGWDLKNPFAYSMFNRVFWKHACKECSQVCYVRSGISRDILNYMFSLNILLCHCDTMLSIWFRFEMLCPLQLQTMSIAGSKPGSHLWRQWVMFW